MKFKEKLTKGELTNLMHSINVNGFNPCDKYVLGFDPINNLYQMKLLKGNEELQLSFASKRIWNLESIKKQLESYIEVLHDDIKNLPDNRIRF